VTVPLVLEYTRMSTVFDSRSRLCRANTRPTFTTFIFKEAFEVDKSHLSSSMRSRQFSSDTLK
jgi:hypothetical protein